MFSYKYLIKGLVHPKMTNLSSHSILNPHAVIKHKKSKSEDYFYSDTIKRDVLKTLSFINTSQMTAPL